MKQYKVLAICGEAGSGKDTLARELLELMRAAGVAARNVVSYTTRPPRDYEKDGVDYHFVTAKELTTLILEDKILEAAVFNDWCYATGINDLDIDKINIAVLNPEGIESLSYDSRIDMYIIRCYCDEKERLIRQLNRESKPNIDEIVRRLYADRKDFDNFKIENYSPHHIILPTYAAPKQNALMAFACARPWAEEDNQ